MYIKRARDRKNSRLRHFSAPREISTSLVDHSKNHVIHPQLSLSLPSSSEMCEVTRAVLHALRQMKLN